ncbi:hypothetical protein PAXRUDRAFT_493302 [Paxillus rubicundulus Ve08.2h10]|uniref:Unplaced genomic scaffold scaffold_3337, whole genome shotgun sequence n=1 Tax=Paxillus rubicundulus Ve08.2h10 TaxID=930991 RepID=A0A0D0CWB3_9AGAM|nr:hypothetical protein PAXRUDRAFT_493302 [Paxillus rubicundulus Ve08.2h10]
MSHWEGPVFLQEGVVSMDGDAGQSWSAHSFDSADYQDITHITVIGECITSPRRDLSDPNSLACQGSLGSGLPLESGLQTSRIEHDLHGWHINPEQDVAHTNNNIPLSASTSLSPAEHYGLPQTISHATFRALGHTPHLNSSGPDTQLPPAPTISQGSRGQGLPQIDLFFASHPAGRDGHRGTLVISSSTCGWRSTDGSICGRIITRPTVPQHLAEHGIANLRSNMPIQCWWCPNKSKKIKRKGIVRHVREVHLHLTRPLASTASVNVPGAYQMHSVLDVTKQPPEADLNAEDHTQGYQEARPSCKRTGNGLQTTCASPPHGGYYQIPPQYAMGDIKGAVPCHDGPGAYPKGSTQCTEDPRGTYEGFRRLEASLLSAEYQKLMDSMPVYSPPIDELWP